MKIDLSDEPICICGHRITFHEIIEDLFQNARSRVGGPCHHIDCIKTKNCRAFQVQVEGCPCKEFKNED